MRRASHQSRRNEHWKRTCTDTCQLNHLPFHGKLPGAGLCQTSAHRQLAGLLCAAGFFFGVVWWFHTVIASCQGATNFCGHSGTANMQQLGLSVTSISHCCQASLSGEVPFSAKAPAGATPAMIFAQALHSSGGYAAASDVFHTFCQAPSFSMVTVPSKTSLCLCAGMSLQSTPISHISLTLVQISLCFR